MKRASGAAAFGGILTGLAALFQLTPAMLTELFAFITILSTFPVYIAVRYRLTAGVGVYLATAVIVSFLSPHEGLLFLCTNGLMGLSLGLSHIIFRNKLWGIALTALVMSLTLSTVNYLLGFPVTGHLPGTIPVQLLILVVFSVCYSALMSVVSVWVYKKVANYLKG